MEIVTQIIRTAGALIALAATYAPMAIGFILPPVVEWLNRDVHSDKEKWIVTFLVCTLAATLTKWSTLLSTDPGEFMKSLSIIFLESQGVYKLYFKDSKARTTLISFMNKIDPDPTAK